MLPDTFESRGGLVLLLGASTPGFSTAPEGGTLSIHLQGGGSPRPVPPEMRVPLAVGQRKYLTLSLLIVKIEYT